MFCRCVVLKFGKPLDQTHWFVQQISRSSSICVRLDPPRSARVPSFLRAALFGGYAGLVVNTNSHTPTKEKRTCALICQAVLCDSKQVLLHCRDLVRLEKHHPVVTYPITEFFSSRRAELPMWICLCPHPTPVIATLGKTHPENDRSMNLFVSLSQDEWSQVAGPRRQERSYDGPLNYRLFEKSLSQGRPSGSSHTSPTHSWLPPLWIHTCCGRSTSRGSRWT